jgi:hypothetical protein
MPCNLNPRLEERKVKALEQIADRLERIEQILKATNLLVDEKEVFRH